MHTVTTSWARNEDEDEDDDEEDPRRKSPLPGERDASRAACDRATAICHGMVARPNVQFGGDATQVTRARNYAPSLDKKMLPVLLLLVLLHVDDVKPISDARLAQVHFLTTK